MQRQPCVSIITIFLNAEAFLDEAINSVLAQTYDDWELVLVDDGSTDDSTYIARRYAEQFPGTVRYLEHDAHRHYGRAASRNLGIRYTSGEFIAWLDADDTWLPHHLQQQVRLLHAQPEVGAVFGGSHFWYNWMKSVAPNQHDYPRCLGAPPASLLKPPALLLQWLQQASHPPVASSIMVRRRVIEHIGGYEEADPGMYGDQTFFAKLCLEVPVLVMAECSTRYRQHAHNGSSVLSRTGQWYNAELAYRRWLTAYVAKRQPAGGAAWDALRKLLWPYRHPRLQRMCRRTWHFFRRTRHKIGVHSHHSRPSPRHLRSQRVRAAVSAGYGLQVLDIEAFPGGSENAAWVVPSDRGAYVAKVYADGAGPIQRIRDEIDLYTYLKANNVHAPMVLSSKRGQPVEELLVGADTYPLVLMRYEKLSYTTPDSITPHEVQALAREVAHMHTVLQRYPARHRLTPRREDSLEAREYHGAYRALMASYNHKASTIEELRTIQGIDQRLVEHLNGHRDLGDLTHSVIHRDLYLFHTPFLPSGRVYFFDWDQVWGPVAVDLVTVCIDLYRAHDVSFASWEARREQFLAGYAVLMPLTAADWHAIDIFMLRRLLGEVLYACSLSRRMRKPIGAVQRSYELVEYLLNKPYRAIA